VRVLHDTNVLVGAVATRGLCADVFRLVAADHEMVVGQVILDELRGVLERKLGLPVTVVAEILELLLRFELVPRPAVCAAAEVPEDDRWVLASARDGRADILVTGDRELPALGECEGVRIVSPRGLWELLRRE